MLTPTGYFSSTRLQMVRKGQRVILAVNRVFPFHMLEFMFHLSFTDLRNDIHNDIKGLIITMLSN